MRIVIDTNILISGIFFGGYPGTIIKAVTDGMLESFVSGKIVDEYREITDSFKEQNAGHFDEALFLSFLQSAKLVEPTENIEISRDPDDDKFLECAIAAKALYIVSGDKDLLVLERFRDIEIITAKAFCERYL